MARSSVKFSQQVAAFVKKVEARATAFVRHYGAEITADLVLRSPVGDPTLWKSPAPPGYVGGHFRANWQVSLGGPPSGVVDGVDAEGDATIAAARNELSAFKLGDKVVVANLLPYARRLEYGWSTQAPTGVVRVTLAGLDGLRERALAAARREVR